MPAAPAPRRRLPLVAAGILAIAALVATGVVVARSPGPQPLSTGPTPAVAATAAPPAAEPTPGSVRPPNAGEATGHDPEGWLVGSARVESPPGTVRDDTGRPVPDAHPAADLLAVTLGGDGTRLQIRWELAAPPPPQHDALLWTVDLWAGDQRRYSVTVQQVGTRRLVGVLDWMTMVQVPLDEPVVDEATLTVEVPADLLAGLPADFRWSALSQVDLAYEDTVPDAAPDGASRAGPVPTAPFGSG
jgi:hypothetical protein